MTDDFVTSVIDRLRSVTGEGRVQLHEPVFAGNEWRYVKECLDTTFVSSVGKFVDRFEADLAAFTGAPHAVVVVNGTAALHMALLLAGVQSGDEVIIPALTFAATANAVAYLGAVPHFADSEERTLGIDHSRLREYLQENTGMEGGHCISKSTGRRIRAIVPMHTFGHPSDMEGLQALAHDFHLALVEDAAESIGSTLHGKHTGTFGLLGTLSFNGNKTITTGGGGAILTGDPLLAKRAKHLTTTAKMPHAWRYEHDEVGYNYRMPNINAALGCAQLELLPDMIEKKRSLFLKYKNAFSDLKGAQVFQEPAGARSNYWLQTLLLSEENAKLRDSVLEETNASGLMTRPAWSLLSKQRPFCSCPHMDLSSALRLEQRIVNIPSSVTLDGNL
jgi:perosamine synthetase